jgi:hypothetical protein
MVTTFFDFFPFPPTLVGYPFFYGIGWLISSSSIFTISLTLSTKFENCENKTRGCSPKKIASFSLLHPLQGSSKCEGCEFLYDLKCTIIGHSQR